jgi:hypothetical protein
MTALSFIGPSPRGASSAGLKNGGLSKGPFPLSGALTERTDYDGIFNVVRSAVRHAIGRERPGLGLGLADLPPNLGAYWQLTGNMIVINEGIVRVMQAMAKSVLEYNSFLYVILAHEYLHSLGFLDEEQNRQQTAWVTRQAFGPDHMATKMAEGDLWQMYPFLRFAPAGDGQRLRVVTKFDTATTSAYIQ